MDRGKGLCCIPYLLSFVCRKKLFRVNVFCKSGFSGMYTLCESCGKVLCISETENYTEERGIVLPFIYCTH